MVVASVPFVVLGVLGVTQHELLTGYPYPERADILAALARWLVEWLPDKRLALGRMDPSCAAGDPGRSLQQAA